MAYLTHFFFFCLQNMSEVTDQTKKPRKRFVGKAKKAANESQELGAIEDGAVGFASKPNS